MKLRHCPICEKETEFKATYLDMSKCRECNTSIPNSDLVSLQHNVEVGDHDLLGEEKYG